MQSLSERKQILRRDAAQHRDRAAREAPDVAARAATGLLKCLRAEPGDVIAGYLPIRSELSPLDAMSELVGRGRDVCVPRVEGKDLPLVFLAWRPGVKLQKGPFGIEIPMEEPEASADAGHCALAGLGPERTAPWLWWRFLRPYSAEATGRRHFAGGRRVGLRSHRKSMRFPLACMM